MDCICSNFIFSSLSVLEKINKFNICTNTQCFVQEEIINPDSLFSGLEIVPVVIVCSSCIMYLLKNSHTLK